MTTVSALSYLSVLASPNHTDTGFLSAGLFVFGVRGGAHTQILSCLHQVLYGGGDVRATNWGKPLLLGHDSRPSTARLPFNGRLEAFLSQQRCNDLQREILRRILQMPHMDRSGSVLEVPLSERLAICQGSPGTGKSELIAIGSYYCILRGIPCMVAAASNKAVDVNARRLLQKLLQNDQSTDGVYRILPDAYEAIYSTPEVGSRDYEDYYEDTYPTRSSLRSIPRDQYQQDPNDPIRASLDAYLDAQLSGNDMDNFSLAKHIKTRLEIVASRGPDWRGGSHNETVEHNLLHRLGFARKLMEEWEPEITAGTTEEQHNPIKNFDFAWLQVQKYYLGKARCLFVTASTAGARACRLAPITVVFIDEASQIKEAETLNAWCRHLSRLQKLALFGDHQQLRATVKSFHVSEFGLTAQTSLMYRQIQIGHPFTMLTEQYRMHPHIAELVNTLIYQNRLTTNASALGRPNAKLFLNWTRHYGYAGHRQALFCQVEGEPKLYQEVDGFSKMNDLYLHAVSELAQNMVAFGIPQSSIAIITFYSAQRSLYKRILKAKQLEGIQLLSVDGSQGDEAPFVILDPVTPGAPDYTLGFLKDLERLCVALSRAQDGLLIIGNTTMADGDYPTLVVKAWSSLIQHLKDVNGCVTQNFGRGGPTRRLLKIPGTAYKPVPTRSEYVD